MHQRADVNQPVRRCPNEYYPERGSRQVLLKGQVLVHRDKNTKLPARTAQQLTILDSRPPETTDRLNLVPGQFWREVDRHVLIK